MAAIERKTKRYLTDLTDEEWARIEALLPRPARNGAIRLRDEVLLVLSEGALASDWVEGEVTRALDEERARPRSCYSRSGSTTRCSGQRKPGRGCCEGGGTSPA
jgi:hypothetical protein